MDVRKNSRSRNTSRATVVTEAEQKAVADIPLAQLARGVDRSPGSATPFSDRSSNPLPARPVTVRERSSPKNARNVTVKDWFRERRLLP